MGGSFSIVPHQCCALSSSELEFAQQAASRLAKAKPELGIDPIFQALVAKTFDNRPCLHVDDLTEIQRAGGEAAVFQERARLRAGNGDVLATSLPLIDGYESYCQDHLGLGSVQWIQAPCRSHPLRLAEACWEDRSVRRELVRHIRAGDMRYIHPHMGSQASWELALLLSQASRRTLEVIAPPPAVTKFANDKGAFATLVDEMFGSEATPANSVAWNAATTAKQLRQLTTTAIQMVAIKLPRSSSGEGNLLIPMTDLRDRSLHEIDDMLRERLPDLKYESGDELLVTQWLEDVVASPSAQIWIPPTEQQLPCLEGIFVQVTKGKQGYFSGFCPVALPHRLEQQITRQCLQLARVYQLLGYVGRCSFDMLLIGSDMESAALEFIECNGRWGGTSLPMTMMNRIFGDWQQQPFSSRIFRLEGARQVSFADTLSALGDELYCKRSGQGKYVLFNPQRTRMRDDFSIVALHDNWQAASDSSSNGPFAVCSDRLRQAITAKNSLA